MKTKIKPLKPYRFKDNPLEQKLFEEFTKEFDTGVLTDLIVFGQRPGIGSFPNDYLSAREKEIVCSVLQWCGTPVGIGFLHKCGFKLEG